MKARYLRHFAASDRIVHGIAAVTEPYPAGARDEGSVFEILARSIASQQLSGAVARRIIERLVAANGGIFPGPQELAVLPDDALRATGFSRAKIAALKDLAAHALDGRLPADAALAAMDDEQVIAHCIAVRGIGRWTAQMLLMFHFGRPDVMPADDFGVRNGFRLAYGLKGLPKPKALLAYAERWKPHRSAGAWYMWRAVELHQQGTLPKRSGRAPRIVVELPKEAVPKTAKRKAGAKAKATAPAKAKAKAKAGPQPTSKAGAGTKSPLNKAARGPRR